MNILDVYINPMKGYTNNPGIVIVTDEGHQLLRDLIYTNNENCYWTQNPETGVTDFLFHNKLSECTRLRDDHFQTPQSEGFGGRIFTIRCNHEGGIVQVDLRGPWSGGCYIANKYLPIPAIEITYKCERFAYNSGYMTIEKLMELCHQFGLPCEIEDTGRGGHWPELTYIDKTKKEWDAATLDYLDQQYKTKTAKWDAYYANRSSTEYVAAYTNKVASRSPDEGQDLSTLL